MRSIRDKQYIAGVKELKCYLLKNGCIYEENYFNPIEDKIIVEKDVLKFSLDIDKDNKLHIACVNNDKNLIYITKDKNKWNKRILSKVKSYYKIKDIKLYTNLNNKTTNNILLLVKDTRSRDMYSVFFYYIKNSNWNLKKIVDLYYDKYQPSFKSDIDYKGNLHILFKTKENAKYKIYYKTYDAFHNKWGLAEKITENTQDIINTLILCDTNNNANIVWCSLLDKNININFIRRKINLYKRTSWKEFSTLPKDISNLTYPTLIQVNNNLKFGWKQNNFYNIIKTSLDKDNWKKSTSIKLDSKDLLMPIEIAGYNFKNFDIIKAPYTYIYLSENDRIIPGIDEIPTIKDTKQDKIQNSDNITDFNDIGESLNDKNSCDTTNHNSELGYLPYLNNMGKSIEESSIVNDIYPNYNFQTQSNDLQGFINKLNSLYKEIEDVKNKELTLLNSILDLRKKNNKIYRKIEEILSDYNEFDTAISNQD
ncbi:hypothetical protein [Maledivibacter halophilus]|uniref:Uncharacterized protein n=1 Tax=Maledivibacter halophilus TaxID=36842 RepID=A0A1T5L1P0_9FIRM|nr:hypothetical protein [Maledivibacter halophilus]SKC69947.1 hypothetical protein SAMN02194393_02346 [Maledivibacter halophilus]